MPKGSKCPKCGELTFHKEKAVMVCSQCGAVGWDTIPGSAGAGKGKKCLRCGNNTVRAVHSDEQRNLTHYFCSTCKSTYFA